MDGWWTTVQVRLPDFPWDSLEEVTTRANGHPEGVVDLSVGTPVDPVPGPIRAALAAPEAQLPGYPPTAGTHGLREAAAEAMRRRFGADVVTPDAVLPTIGSKELVAWLPILLELGPDDTVVVPELAYPTYEVGARLAGARWVRADTLEDLERLRARRVSLVWLNSPSNPTGRVQGTEELRAIIAWARNRGAVIASDECYLALADPEVGAVSTLHPSVCQNTSEGVLALHSLSKSSNMAGYRAAFVTGDPALVAQLLEVRRHTGMMVSRPVQAAMTAALCDDDHVRRQWQRYRARRERLRPALERFGLKIEHSEAGLYLWAGEGKRGRETVARLAELGVLVAPGEFYGPAGADHVRVSLTATDERIDAAVTRLENAAYQ
jgi:succinyldiaminopimelate transaminase